MDPDKFYKKKRDSTGSKIQCKLEQGVKRLQSNPLPAILPKKLCGPSSEWRVLTKQEEALNYASRFSTSGLMTFAFEQRVPDNNGRRCYLVAHPDNVFRQHISTPEEKRCTYEVIPEHSPCKLYFDLEYSKEHNPEKKPDQIVDLFNRIILWALKEEYGLALTLSDILVLDASTSVKFSQHLIYQLPQGTAFLNNRHAGLFIKDVCQKVMESRIPICSEEELKMLLVATGKDSDTERLSLFCDLGVYTKNRNFRLYLSTKFGKNAPFVLARTNRWEVGDMDPNRDEKIFFASLISHFQSVPTRLLEWNGESSGKSNGGFHLQPREATRGGYSSSPWPQIDEFINNLVLPGRVRRWIYYEHSGKLVFEITGNRYCGNIGRWHKSNNIKYVVDLQTFTYHQSCFDPDCQDYNSDFQLLPSFLHFAPNSLNPQNDAMLGDKEIPDDVLAEIADVVELFVNEKITL